MIRENVFNIAKMSVIGATGALFFLAASAQAETKKPTPEDEFLEDETALEFGGNGGVWIREDPENYLAGPITAFRICAGARIDSIQVRYGDANTGKWGKKLGGGGGDCGDTWELDGQKVDAIRVRHGDGIDGLEFEVSGVANKKFGGGGGVESLATAKGGGDLAYVEARAGAYVDRIRLVYGLPYYIDNVVLDDDKISDAVKNAKLVELSQQCVINNTSRTRSPSATVSEERTVSESLSFGLTTNWGVSSTIAYGSEDSPVRGETTVNIGQEISKNKKQSVSETKKLGLTVPAVADPYSGLLVTFSTRKLDLDIPFDYEIVHYRGKRDNEVDRQKFRGVYKAVSYSDVEYEYDDTITSCPSGSKLLSNEDRVIKPPVPGVGKPDNAPANTASVPPSAPQQPSQETTQPIDVASTPPAQPAASPEAPIDNRQIENVPPAAAHTATDNTGVSCVYASNGVDETAFRLGDDGYWREEVVETGEARFTFAEVERSDGEILLQDIDRGIFIGLDLDREKITYADSADSDFFDLYEITGIETE